MLSIRARIAYSVAWWRWALSTPSITAMQSDPALRREVFSRRPRP